MATTRKYAGLPDIDINSRDVFETPDLADDISTLPTSPSRSTADDDEIDDREISHPRIKPSTARNVFTNAVVDASDVDFSDRVSGKRKSYKASTRRRRERGEDVVDEGYDDEGSDSDAEESVGRKLARLRREVEELKGMVDEEKREKAEAGGEVAGSQNEEEEDGWGKLTEVLDGLMTARGNGDSAESILSKKLVNGLKVPPGNTTSTAASTNAAPSTSQGTTSYTVSYSPHFKKTHTLAKVADFDTRITLLERLLGISASVTLTTTGQQAIIPSIDTLTNQLTLLSSSTNTTLDAAARRVKALTNDAEKLTEARKAARAARVADEELMIASANTGDPENESKINALYGTLSTIEGLSPLLPAVMDRLRSLRGIHSEAARSVQALAEVERKQAEMQSEIDKWKIALEKVEGVVKDNEKTVGRNMKVVEGWVKELEARMDNLA